METALHVTAETLRRLALPLQGSIPTAAVALLDQLGVAVGEDHVLEEESVLPPPAPVFPRFVESAEAGGVAWPIRS